MIKSPLDLETFKKVCLAIENVFEANNITADVACAILDTTLKSIIVKGLVRQETDLNKAIKFMRDGDKVSLDAGIELLKKTYERKKTK